MQEQFVLIDSDGIEHQYIVLVTFSNDETGKDYIIYRDVEPKTDENGNDISYAAIHYPDEEESPFEEITTEREWEIVESIIEECKNTRKKDPDLAFDKTKEDELKERVASQVSERFLSDL